MDPLIAYLDGFDAGLHDLPSTPPGLVVEVVVAWIEGWRRGSQTRRTNAGVTS